MFKKNVLIAIFVFCGLVYSNFDYVDAGLHSNQKSSVFASDFGTVKSTVTKHDSTYEILNQSDRFYYRQVLIEKNDSIYVVETEQKIKIFLFFKKHSIVNYNKPLLRYPKRIMPDSKWSWDGFEYAVGKDDSSESHINCYSLGYDTVETELGKLEALQVVTEVENSSGSKNVVKEWLNKDLGMVKSEVSINGGGIMGLLRDLLGFGNIVFTIKEPVS